MNNKHAIWIIPLVASAFMLAFLGTGNSGREPQQSLPGATFGMRLTSPSRGKMEVSQTAPEAYQYGVRVGDHILEVDGAPIRKKADFIAAAAKKKEGDKLQVVLKRDGRQISLVRKYEGPIGVTRLETAATQGITIASSKKKRKNYSVARASVPRRPKLQPKAKGPKASSAPPTFVPEFEEFEL